MSCTITIVHFYFLPIKTILSSLFKKNDSLLVDNNFFTFVSLLCEKTAVCFLPIYSGRQGRWMYQPGSHRRKVAPVFSSTFLLRRMPLFFSREEVSYSFPSSTVKLNSVYLRFNRSPRVGHLFYLSFLCEKKSQLPGFELTSQSVRRLRGYQLSYRGDRQYILCLRVNSPR